MGISTQYIIVAVIIAAAIAVVIKKVVALWRKGHDRSNRPQCTGCPLADKCSKTGDMAKKCDNNLAHSRN